MELQVDRLGQEFMSGKVTASPLISSWLGLGLGLGMCSHQVLHVYLSVMISQRL